MRIPITPFLVCLGAVLGIACAGLQLGSQQEPAVFKEAQADSQMAHAVKIQVSCEIGNFNGFSIRSASRDMGSGGLYGEKHVLTAWHVVDCKGARVTVELMDGQRTSATIKRALPSEDLALLELAKPVKGAVKPRIGKPPGGPLCFVAMVPFQSRRCGIPEYRYRHDQSGDLQHSAVTFPGNSGSLVYNEAGELVGVVTHMMAYKGQIFSGLISTLHERQWILPKN